MSLKYIKAGLVALFIFCLLLSTASSPPIPIEQAMSMRASIRNYTGADISQQHLLDALKAAYGYWGDHRSIPLVSSNYCLSIFVVNSTGSYLYNPGTNTVSVYNLSVDKDQISPKITQGYASSASVVLIIVWNQTKQSNVYFASLEAGFLVQNVYLAVLPFGLGTVCVTTIDSSGLVTDLNLSPEMTPLLAMPIGEPPTEYPSATPDYTRMNGNLPPVQYSTMSFEDALGSLLYAVDWSNQSLSTQELSQLLWASYGYSSTDHRTVPAAVGVYTLKIYFSNSTGIYNYIPESHSITTVASGDKRIDIASAGGGTWAANAPVIFIMVYDSTMGNDGGLVSHEWVEVNTGTAIQNMLLEAAAWNLSGNVLSQGLQDWDGAGAESLRTILGLSSSFIPLYVVPIGHDGVVPEFSTFLILLLIAVVTIVAIVFVKVYDRRKPDALLSCWYASKKLQIQLRYLKRRINKVPAYSR